MTMAFPSAPDPGLSPGAWDEARWRSIESWKLARSSRRPFPLKALGTLLLGLETAARGWDPWNAPRPAIFDPPYAVLGMIVAVLSVTAIVVNRSWLFRIIAVVGVLCVLEVLAGWAGVVPWARWDLFKSGYVERLVLHAVLITIALRRLLNPIDYSELGNPARSSRWWPFRSLWLRFRLNRSRDAHLRALPAEQEVILTGLERHVRELRHTDPSAADDVIELRAGRHRWRARLYPHGVLLVRLGAHEWRAVSPRRFRLREPQADDVHDPPEGALVAVIDGETHPAEMAPELFQRYRAWAGY